ncbi:MAG TPA: peptidoglycan endopeptidase [Sphingomicrobium sp.]
MNRVVKRARALLGTRFRPQGRDSDHGLDCVGLLLCAFDIDTAAVRRNYRLRGDHKAELEAELERHFRRVRDADLRPGDVMLMAVTNDQLHLGIRTEIGCVHADAGIGRVVETAGEPRWPVIAVYRKRRAARREPR